MDILLSTINNYIDKLYSKQNVISSDTFSDVLFEYYKILETTVNKLDSIYFEKIIKSQLNDIFHNENFLTCVCCIIHLLTK
jgi:hypothetical protein